MKKKKLIRFIERIEAFTQDKNTAIKIRKFMTKHQIWPKPIPTAKQN
jgi:hypothetical protein